MMTTHDWRLSGGLSFLLILSFIISCSADGSWENSEGILLTEEDHEAVSYDELIKVTDVFALLDRMSGKSLSPNMSLLLFEAEPGAILSPNAVLPVPEVLFITEGTARVRADDEEIMADSDDVVYIPSQKIRMVENAGNTTLGFYSVIDWNTSGGDGNLIDLNMTNRTPDQESILQIRSEDIVSPDVFGNTSTNEVFSFYRLLHPMENPYLLPYDLGTVRLSNNTLIPDHYIEGRYQLMNVLSGTGNISVGCHEYPVQPGDILYAAPGAVMNISAHEDLHLMVITNPYYQAEYDQAIPDACNFIL